MIELFRLLKAQNEFSDPHDRLSQVIHQVLDEDAFDIDLLSEEELFNIQAAAGLPDHMLPERDKDR